MKPSEMQTHAVDALDFFIKAMPDVPFTADDIIFEFVKKSEMATRAKALCTQYCPDKKLNAAQCRQLNTSIAANALIGREKSAVLVRHNSRIGKKDFRRIILHELMHIFCAKTEMDGTHFIDIYGSGTTPDNPEDEVYDGLVHSGYQVWTEFIAQYYAIMLTDGGSDNFSDVAKYVSHLLSEVTANNLDESKGSFAVACAHWLNCADLEDTLNVLNTSTAFMSDDVPHGEEARNALRSCIKYIYTQIQKPKPWKIDEEFIYGLGFKFGMFRSVNSFYMGEVVSQ
jgi:hypothetical protein